VRQCPTNLDSPGRSGAQFFMSHDRHFIVKTIDGDEYAELSRILKDYHAVVAFVCGCCFTNIFWLFTSVFCFKKWASVWHAV